MATVSDRRTAKRSSSRGRTASNSSRSKSRGRETQKRSTAPRASQQRQKAGGSRSRNSHGGHDARTNVGLSIVSATVGVAGGVLLGRTALAREHKVLGIPLPKKVDLGGVSHQIGEAGR